MDAVVKVYCIHTEPNHSLPWQVRGGGGGAAYTPSQTTHSVAGKGEGGRGGIHTEPNHSLPWQVRGGGAGMERGR